MLNLLYPLVLMQSIATPPVTPPPPPPTPCDSKAHSGFDLWVGEWDVFPNGQEKQVGTSRIERLSGGCTIQEQWMPLQGTGGISLSTVNHNTGRWEQTWVGSDGNRVDFEGGVVDGKMVLTGYWDNISGQGRDALIRITYSKTEYGAVRQFGQASTDHGLSWQTSFDLIYRPKDQAAP